jgi:anaerobic dimethyl sulfoxide reductase subunit C (anchor subunit)
MEIQWTLVFFTLLTCMGCGLFAAIAAAGLGEANFVSKKGVMAALAMLAVGGFSSVFHLAHPFRAIYILTNLNTEFGKEMLLLAAVGVLMSIYLVKADKVSDSARKTICVLSLVFTAWMAFQSGFTYVLVARASWNTFLLPLAYLASACALGCIAFCLIVREASEQVRAKMRLASFGAIIAQGILYLAYVSVSFTSTEADTSLITSSNGLVVFWLGTLLCGIVLPFVLLFPHHKISKRKSMLPLAFSCAIIGGVAFRAMMYLLGANFTLVL